MDGFDRLYETARALGEETRIKIYRAICTSDDPIPVSALAESFSLHPNAIRQHLARLEQAGLVVSRADRDGTGAGRPRRLYEPSPQPLEFAHPPHSMRSLVSVLAEAIDALPSDHRTLVRFGRGWGRSWAARRKREINGSSPRSRRGRAELLARELRDWGWRPTTVREGPQVRLSTGQCLFRDVIGADTNGRCCALEEGLLGGLVEALANGQAKVVRADGCRLSVDF
ncbi:MAG TPA: helix-turn-helix domain-containing protein [Actinomycetota bacterium]|nr:helix-turn-helix domain-containing protein [Actinomycetota bacterium]